MTTTTKTTVTSYTTVGSVRGGCGHQHRTIQRAVECIALDHAGCKSQGGYSDRQVRYGDGTPLDDTDSETVAAIEYDARIKRSGY